MMMRFFLTSLGLSGLAITAGIGVGCGDSSSNCEESKTCPCPPDAIGHHLDDAGFNHCDFADDGGIDASADARDEGRGDDAAGDGHSDSPSDGPTETGITCDGGAIVCNGQCVDSTSPAHCGSCTNVCGSPSSGHGSATCSAPNTCGVQCDNGFHACQSNCVADGTEPSVDPCSIDDAHGVFVSVTTGADGAAGTKMMPLKKIQDGIAKAKMAGKNLYVCAGTYAENVVIDTSKDGVQVFGGFDCTGWAYSASNSVKVQPGAGYALRLDTLTTGTRIEDIEFDGPNGASAGDSSIAVFANIAQAVTLKRVLIKSGNGVAGADGSMTTNYAHAQADTGNPSSSALQGASKTCSCSNGDQTIGAHGGSGDPAGGSDGADGLPALPENPVGLTPKHDGKRGSGAVLGGNGCSSGDPGANPTATASGGAGATAYGALTGAGWSNASGIGLDGAIGKIAQGGGGGGGGVGASNGGGGGGGCGGCGGGKGTAGNPGGSSFALVSFNSGITLDACTITAGSAAKGGNGGDGQVGQSGGLAGNPSQPGCAGGAGGNGGAGGAGDGGAGGLSVAIFYKGMQPTTTNGTTATHGAGASGGAAGANGSPAATPGLTTAPQDVMMAP
jgi:hypothetical protein